jgi:hypothetical protein
MATEVVRYVLLLVAVKAITKHVERLERSVSSASPLKLVLVLFASVETRNAPALRSKI